MTQAPSPVALERHIRLDGPGNFRDLGGYPVAGGNQVRWRTVFRSDGLETLSPRDRQIIVEELQVGVVIDLRSPREAEQCGTFAQADGPEGGTVRLVPLPILDDASGVVERVRAARAGRDFRMADLLTYMLETCSDRFVGALRLLAESEGPVVFHCAAGKDRTGLLAALLQGVLGAEEADILTDYGYSRRAVPLLRERWHRRSAEAATAPAEASGPPAAASSSFQSPPPATATDRAAQDAAEELLSAEPATLAEALAFVRHRHGSSEQWALDRGATQADLARLRDRLLEPSSRSAAG